MVNQVAHANGVVYTQALDPNAMRRPASYSTSGATTNWTSGAYAYDGAGNVAAIDGNGYLYDPVSRLTSATEYTGALGTPRLITGTSGAYRSYHLYHPYGAEATAFNQDAERLKFTAHERDLGNLASAADDIDYMHARFYQPQVGRFGSVDPLGGKSRIPKSWNRYTYALNNKIRRSFRPRSRFTAGADDDGTGPNGGTRWNCHEQSVIGDPNLL